MKKRLLSIVCAVLLLIAILPLSACNSGVRELRILSWEDYIDIGDVDVDGTVRLFEKYWEAETGEKIKVIYDTADTNEDMYRRIAMEGESFDLICPSDYMIEKMINENLLLQLDLENIPNAQNISPYILDLMAQFTPKLPASKSMDKYAVGYMWGTLGILYDEDAVGNDELNWSLLWSTAAKYNNKITMKDSVRDSYLAAAYYLMEQNNPIFADLDPNNVSSDARAAIKNALIAQKPRLKGYEVDEGKGYLIDGTASLCLQWAGDAMAAIEESSRNLNYAIPEIGGNVFFDAYVVPKTAKDKELAEAFINFLCTEEIALNNMDYIGYTSCVGTEYMFELLTEDAEDLGSEATDVSYFFQGVGDSEFSLAASPLRWIQYPPKATLDKCKLMFDFGDTLEQLEDLWTAVRTA